MGALVGTAPTLETGIGFEEVTRGALKLLIDKLNDEIVERTERWDSADLEWQEFADSIGQTDVESVPLDHFHEGPHQSLLEAPVTAFPAISVMSYYAQPSPGERFDQFETASMRLFIEAFVRAGPVADGTEVQFETIVHRRIQRTTEAINAVIMRDKTLCSTAKPGISSLPRGGIGGQSWVRQEEGAKGPRHFWQGSRLEYALQRHSIY